MKFHIRFRIISFLILILFSFGIRAADDLKRLREANAKATPCGLYLASVANNSVGVKVADADPESVRKYFDSNPDLSSKLIYIDRESGNSFKSAEDLKAAIDAKRAMPLLNHPELVWVGLPQWGKEKNELLDLTEQELNQKIPGTKITVRDLWRPNREMSSLPAYIYQQLRYLFPSMKLDYQKPLPAERSAAYWKLLVSNGSQQIFLFIFRPWHIALATGVVNFTNSYYTGVYRRFMSNWFNRSVNSPARWARNVGLSSFFTSDLYWAGRESWDKFKEIASAAGWGKFAHEKWGATFFGVLWRYYFQQGIIRWEKEMERAGRSGDARRTAGRLEFIGTFLTTPAFIYSTVAPALFTLKVMGVPIMGMNGGHFVMIGVGVIGALHYYQIPMSPKWYWSQIFRSRFEGDAKRLSWGPWVSRLDHFHEFNKKWTQAAGLHKAADFLERMLRFVSSVGWRKADGDAGGPINGDVRKLIDMDGNLVKWLEQDPVLHKMLQEDPELRRLVETDSHFVELRDELLKENN